MIKRNISFIVTNQFFTTVADRIFDLGILWYVYQMTDSALFASFVTAITALTAIFFGPVIGVIVDRKEPKSSMQFGYGIMIIVGMLLCVIYFYSIDWILLFIYIAIILQQFCMLLIEPAKNKLIPRIVVKNKIVQTNGFVSSTSQAGEVIGQSLSGILIGLIGFAGVMLTHSGVYLLASILLSFVISIKSQTESLKEGGEEKKPQAMEELKEGWKVLKQNRPIFKMFFLAMAVNMTTIATSLLVVLVTDQYQATAIQFGFMNAVGAIAGIIVGIFANKIIPFTNPNIITGSMLAAAGIGFIGAGLTDHFTIGVHFFVIIVASSILIHIIFNSLLMMKVEDEFRGRVFTLTFALAMLLMPILSILGGLIADVSHVSYLFVFAGLWAMAWGVFSFMDRDLRSIEKLPKSETINKF